MNPMRNGKGVTLCYGSAHSFPLCCTALLPPGEFETNFLGCLGFRDEGVFEEVNHSSAQLCEEGTSWKWSPETCISISILPVTRAGKRGKEYILNAYHAPCHALDTRCHYLILSFREAYEVDILTPFQMKKSRLPALSDLLVNHEVMN